LSFLPRAALHAVATDLLLPLAGLVAALAAVGFIFQWLRLPPAVGYLLVGLAGAQFVAELRVPETAIHEAAGVGVLFLLFAIGLELDIQRLREALRRTALALPVDILVPALLVAGAVRLFAGWTFLEAMTLGLCVSISSTLFGERLSSGSHVPPEARRRVLGMLLSEDVVAGALLALLVVLGTPNSGAWAPVVHVGKLLLFLVLAAAMALLVVPRLLDAVARRHSHELLVLTGIALVVGFGALGEWAAHAAPLGALVAGVAAAEAGSRFVLRNALQTVREMAMAAFFFASGLAVNPGALLQQPLLVVGIAVLFLLAKVLVHVPSSMASGLGLAAALRTALALGTLGEFSLIMVATAAGLGSGLAHPLLRDAVVGAMVVLLLVVPLLSLGVPGIVRSADRLPDRFRKPLQWFVHSARESRPRPPDAARLRAAVRLLVVNLVLLVAWVLLAVALGPFVGGRLPSAWQGFPASVGLVGIALAIAVPLVVGTTRAYRTLVWLVVGSGGEGHDRASQMRIRLVDAWVAVSVAMLLIPLGLLAPDILPILLGGVFLAIIIVTLAWRRLSAFHQTMEASLARVLGHDPESGAVLDHLLERYPWGIRFTAVAVPPESPVAGMRLGDARIQELTGATVAVIQRRGREIVNPGPGEHLLVGDTLILLGDVHQIARGEALVVAHGEALRLTAQSRLAGIAEVEVHEGSSLVGTTLSAADIRQRTGTLVVGVWPKGAQHPGPYDGTHRLAQGDRLILLGAPLQVERARLLAEGMEVESSVDSSGEAPAA
jgi:monovalent cation:H+ antiporter-2, CPA2 family